MDFDFLGTHLSEFAIHQKSFKKCLSNEKLTYYTFTEKFNNVALDSHIYQNVLVYNFDKYVSINFQPCDTFMEFFWK